MAAFQATLSPHGEWVNAGSYGTAWRPNVAEVGVGFRPYATGGHWMYSDVGWAWESEFDWGWAPFHYGRWILDPNYGWMWIPDTVWAPAWVTWRFGGGLVGWAPLAPLGFVAVESYQPYWCFVQHNYFLEHNIYHYATAVDYHRAFSVTAPVTSTVTINGATRVWAGPPAGAISAATGRPVTPVQIGAPRPGLVQPHTVNGISAPQFARQNGEVPGHAYPPGYGYRPGAGYVPPGRSPTGYAYPAARPYGAAPATGYRAPPTGYPAARVPSMGSPAPVYRAPSAPAPSAHPRGR